MPLLDAEIQKQIKDRFAEMSGPVKLVMFTQGEGGALECDMCRETRDLLEEVVALSDQLSLEVRDFVGDEAEARAYGIDKIPAVAILGGGPQPRDYGIRLYGIPAGYEFSTLIEDILMVSGGEHSLNPRTLEALTRLTQPVHIQVYVTPT
jgi:glutaredoxin-like protein